MAKPSLDNLKTAIREGRTMSARFKRDQAMRIGSQTGHRGALLCAFVRGFTSSNPSVRERTGL